MTVRRRVTLVSVLVAVAAVLVLGIPLALVDAARVRTDETARLEREADAVAAIVDDRVSRGLPVTAKVIAPFVHQDHRITVVRGDRTIVAGARLPADVVSARAGSARTSVVTAAAPTSETGERVARSWLLIAALSVGGIAAAFALATSLSRRLSRPLDAVAAGSARLGDGDFSVRVPPSGVPDIDAIADALGRSARRIAGFVGREREFSSNVSHQLRTPLTALRLRLEEALRETGDEAVRDELRAAVREADRLEATVADLLAYARAERAGRRVAVPLDRVVREHVAAWRPVMARAHRSLALQIADDVAVAASRGTVGQVLDVLLENALRHGAGPVTVTVRRSGDWASVAVEDAGSGVAAQDAERIFERGQTDANGTGIGLHLARALADADGGTLRLSRPQPPRFELRLRVFTGS